MIDINNDIRMRAFLIYGFFWSFITTLSAQEVSDVFDQIQENVWYLSTEDEQANLYITHLGRGDTVVALHGGPGNNFNYLVDAIKNSANANLFLLFDQRGSIYSPVADSLIAELSLDMLVDDLEAIRKATNQEKLTLFGHSFGTLLAISYYLKYPQNTRRIVLTATMPPFIDEERSFREMVTEIHARTKTLRTRPEVDEILRKEGLHDQEGLSPKQQSDRFKITGLASFNMIDLNNWRRFKGGRVFYNVLVDGAIGSSIPSHYDIRQALRKFPVPITIIQGAQDYIDPGASHWKEVANEFKSVDIAVVDQAGHYIWLDKPEEFANLLESSLTQNNNQ